LGETVYPYSRLFTEGIGANCAAGEGPVVALTGGAGRL
jgi:hypothetical protein